MGRAVSSCVVFDTRWCGAHGIGRFATELYGRLPRFSPIAIGGKPSSPLDPLILRAYLRKAQPRLFFSPGYNFPAGGAWPFVFCLHDLNHRAPDEPRGALKRAYYDYFLRPAIFRAEKVLTVSEYSRQEICEWAKADPGRIVNVGNGVSGEFVSEGRKFDESGRPYFLHLGGSRPNKNMLRVLAAMAGSSGLRDCALVCVGSVTAATRRRVCALGLKDRVLFAGNVEDDRLAGLYRGAVALVFVSLREGFGLPIVEAMACGCPVMTSSVTSMPEVAGGAAILVDPTDVEAIRAHMETVLQDSTLRASLRARGIRRAEEFHWDRTAQRVRTALAGLGV